MIPARSRALAPAAALVLAVALLPAPYAAADVDCTPTIDQSSVHVSPEVSVLGSKGSVELAVTATIAAPCGRPDGSDLFVDVGLSPVDIEHNLDWTVSSDVMPAGGHTYQLATTVRVRATKIHDADASTWDASVGVVDTDDPGEYGLTTYSDPVTVTIRRASSLTADAGPEPVRNGRKVTVKGTLRRASWDAGHDRPLGGRSVELQFRPTKGSWTTLTTVTSSKKGKVKAKVTATVTGDYRLAFAGSASTAPSRSGADHVKVH